MNTSDYIGKTVTVHIDRPLGSRHPEYHFEYPVNYGFIPDTLAGDGKEIDVYVLGVDHPLDKVTATVVAVVRRKDDVEDKLVATPDGRVPSKESIAESVRFQERFFDTFTEFGRIIEKDNEV